MKAVGIILAGGKNERLGELTSLRAPAALPVGSCYRAIDFPLSNMANSGINKVAIITQFNSRSLHDHLSSAKWWDLGSKHGGLFIFTPFMSAGGNGWFRGTADCIYQNLSFLNRSNEPNVIIAQGEGIYKMDFNEVLAYHTAKEADITIAYQDMADKGVELHDFGILEMDEDNRLLDFEEKPIEPATTNASLGIYVISRTLLIKLLETIVPEARYELVKDIIIRYRKKLRIYGYEFKSYWSTISSVNNYYGINMDFLKRDVRNIFLREKPYIETKPKDEPPAKYNYGARVTDSLIGSGSILNGYVNKSVLFRRVFTGDNSSITNSIIMEGSFIGNNCVIENAIIDKEVIVSDGKVIRGGDAPFIIGKSTVI